MKRVSLFMASLAVASAAFATTYVRVEKDGSKTYSDRPLPGGQPVDLQPAQTYSSPPSAIDSSGELPREQELLRKIDDFTYTSCSLSPENDATFTNPENVPITVTTQPDLRPGDILQITVDGKPAAQNATQAVLQPADRGTHTASVNIRDGFGRTLCSSSVTFHVFRPSVKLPARR